MKLNELKHYKTEYKNIEGLREHFDNQLEKLANSGFMELKQVSKNESQDKQQNVTNITKINTINNQSNSGIFIQDVSGKDINITR